jgi:hypothetical protein
MLGFFIQPDAWKDGYCWWSKVKLLLYAIDYRAVKRYCLVGITLQNLTLMSSGGFWSVQLSVVKNEMYAKSPNLNLLLHLHDVVLDTAIILSLLWISYGIHIQIMELQMIEDDWWMMNWKGLGRKWSNWGIILVFDCSNEENYKNFGGSPWGDLNPALPKYILKHYYYPSVLLSRNFCLLWCDIAWLLIYP